MHAYLVMAHNNFNILREQLKLLDYELNDIYIHIDKKVKDVDIDEIKKICSKANIYFTPSRINVKWGSVAQVKAEMLLYKTALENSGGGTDIIICYPVWICL